VTSKYLQDCFERKIIFFTGKGGVGKSTLAWATATAVRRTGRRVLLASWSPFDPVTKSELASDGLEFLVLDPMTCFREYALLTVKFERLYDLVFENRVLKAFIVSAPGLADTVIAGKLDNLYETRAYDLIVVDLPSSGHTLSFFQSPTGIQRIFAVGPVNRDTTKICEHFKSPDCRLDFVSIPEDLSLTENKELKTKMEQVFPMNFGFLHLNLMTPRFDLPPASTFPAPGPQLQRQEYSVLLQRDDEARETAKDFKLPVIEMNRLDESDSSRVVSTIARHLEET
jgi:energy-coupling factor transporter ATP-binding protein EcfA2